MNLEDVKKAEIVLKDVYSKIDDVCFYNSRKVISAFWKENVNEACFNSTTGYGYGDYGRDIIEKVYADVFNIFTFGSIPSTKLDNFSAVLLPFVLVTLEVVELLVDTTATETTSFTGSLIILSSSVIFSISMSFLYFTLLIICFTPFVPFFTVL